MRRFHVPIHAVIRVDEVDRQGVSRVSRSEGGTVAPFPLALIRPDRDPKSP